MSFVRRLTIHYKDLQKNPPPLCFAEPKNPDENMAHWIGYIDGPENTPYDGGRFHLTIDFPFDYPFRAPDIRFVTPVYHPNVSLDGEICLDLLHTQWSPVLGIRHLLISLCSLLTDPNSEHGLNKDALALYRSDPTNYDEVAREWTKQYAMNGTM